MKSLPGEADQWQHCLTLMIMASYTAY